MTLDLCMPTAGAYCQRGAVGPRPMVGLLYEVGISDCSLVLIVLIYLLSLILTISRILSPSSNVGETGAHWDTGHYGTMGFPGKPLMGES